ncbi:MAG: hypothetical protein K0M63_07635 [Weeksellaceae bacterium]|nr:hypothetical protein [Weeksellaceae bacterium]
MLNTATGFFYSSTGEVVDYEGNSVTGTEFSGVNEAVKFLVAVGSGGVYTTLLVSFRETITALQNLDLGADWKIQLLTKEKTHREETD